MYMSKRVPLHIGAAIRPFLVSLCAQVGLDFERERSHLVYALHPGGPAILNRVRDRLGLEEKQFRYSRDVLRRYGNMSSAAVPHIWQAIVETDAIAVGSRIVSVAFGPGLTAIGALFEKV
jgi:predicted naringenin-chalcone synthase